MNPFDDPDKLIFAAAGETRHANLQHRIFYDKNRHYGRFLGLCWENHLQVVGLITDVVLRYPDGGLETMCATSFHPGHMEEMRCASDRYSSEMDQKPCYFYFVDEFSSAHLENTAPNKRWPPLKRSIRRITGVKETFTAARPLADALASITRFPFAAKE